MLRDLAIIVLSFLAAIAVLVIALWNFAQHAPAKREQPRHLTQVARS